MILGQLLSVKFQTCFRLKIPKLKSSDKSRMSCSKVIQSIIRLKIRVPLFELPTGSMGLVYLLTSSLLAYTKKCVSIQEKQTIKQKIILEVLLMEETPNNQSLQMYLCAQSTGRDVLVCTGRRATCSLCRGPPIRQRQRNFLEGPLPIACSDNLLQGHSGRHRHIDLQTTMRFRNGLRRRKTLPCITVHIMLVPRMFPGAAQDPKVNRLV